MFFYLSLFGAHEKHDVLTAFSLTNTWYARYSQYDLQVPPPTKEDNPNADHHGQEKHRRQRTQRPKRGARDSPRRISISRYNIVQHVCEWGKERALMYVQQLRRRHL